MKPSSVWLLLIVTLGALCQANLDIQAVSLSSRQQFQDYEKAALGNLRLSVRDSMSGLFIRPQIRYVNPKDGIPKLLSINASGENQYKLSTGRYDFEIAAQNYRTLKTHFAVEPQASLNITVWVDPNEPPEELRPETVQSKLRPGYAMFHGHILDNETGNPLRKVRVFLEQAGIETKTDSRGYFLLYVPAPSIESAEELPGTDNLIADLDGYKTYNITNILLGEGGTHFIIDMERGEGVTGRDNTHKLMLSPEELKNSQARPPSTIEKGLSDRQDGNISKGVIQPLSVTVPSSIRVGFNCSCATCSSVQVYSLDTYVRLGLDDEWISSWNANSLKAGAVAYRSYGVYHVYHPRNVNYDICSTTCCQVIDPLDSSSNTDNATLGTAGVIVVDSSGTAPFFAEYAAENNDNFCVDGVTGSPSFNWPCMSDAVDAGTTFNGHGRGMCQWGSQRWAINQAKDWMWIVNHYYNDNGNPSGARSGLLQIPSAPDFSLSISPSSVTLPKNGGKAIYTVAITRTGGDSDSVNLIVSGLPAGAIGSFSPNPATGNSSTLTVTVSSTTVRGTYPFTVTGNGSPSGLTRTTTATLIKSQRK